MVMWNWPVGQPSGVPMDWSQWQTPGTGAPGWYYDMNGMLRYQPVPGSARVVGEGGPELEQNYIDPLTGRLVVNVMPMGGQGENPFRQRVQDFRQGVQERFPQAQELRTRLQETQQQWRDRMMQPQQPPPAAEQPPAGAQPPPAAPQRAPWRDRMRRPLLPGGEEGPQLQGQRGQGGMRWFFPQGAAGPAVPGMQQGGQLTAPLPSYITNLFSGNPQGMASALGALFQNIQTGRGRQQPGNQQGGGGTQTPPASSAPPPATSAPPAASGSTPGQPFGGVWPPPEAPGTITINRYSPEALGNQPFIQTLRGQPRPAFQGFGAPLSNPALGIENMPLPNLQRYYELLPSEQKQTESAYSQGFKLDFADLLEMAFRASPQAMQQRPTFYGG